MWATTEIIVLIVVIISSINLLLYSALHVQKKAPLFSSPTDHSRPDTAQIRTPAAACCLLEGGPVFKSPFGSPVYLATRGESLLEPVHYASIYLHAHEGSWR